MHGPRVAPEGAFRLIANLQNVRRSSELKNAFPWAVTALLARCLRRTFRRSSGVAWCNCRAALKWLGREAERRIIRIVPRRRPDLFAEISASDPLKQELWMQMHISITKQIPEHHEADPGG
jgi:hypothetical protein